MTYRVALRLPPDTEDLRAAVMATVYREPGEGKPGKPVKIAARRFGAWSVKGAETKASRWARKIIAADQAKRAAALRHQIDAMRSKITG